MHRVFHGLIQVFSGAVTSEDTGTEAFALTPSSTDIQDIHDVNTEALKLTPNELADIGPYSDAATELFKFTPSGTDVFDPTEGTTYIDQATEPLKLTPSAAIVEGYADEETELLHFTPFPASLIYGDIGTERVALLPSTDEHHCPGKVEFEGELEARWSAEKNSHWRASFESRWDGQFLGIGEGFAC